MTSHKKSSVRKCAESNEAKPNDLNDESVEERASVHDPLVKLMEVRWDPVSPRPKKKQ